MITHKVLWPNSIIVDYIQDRLYWIDAHLDWIESSTFTGEARRTVFHMKAAHPFSLTILGNRLFWTDWSYTAVHSVLTNGTDFRMVHSTTARPMGLVAVHSSRQPHFDSPCAGSQNTCEHICLARPAGFYTCLCHIGYQLINERQCVMSKPYMQQELRSSERNYTSSTVAGIICACILCVVLLVVVGVFSRKYLAGLVDSSDEKGLLDYEVDSPKVRQRRTAAVSGGSPNPCYDGYSPPNYVVKFHKNQATGSSESPESAFDA